MKNIYLFSVLRSFNVHALNESSALLHCESELAIVSLTLRFVVRIIIMLHDNLTKMFET